MRLRLPCLLAWMVACTVGGADDDDTSGGPTSADDDDDGDASLTMDATTPIDDGGNSTDTTDTTTAPTTDGSTTDDASDDDPSSDDDDESSTMTDASSSTGDPISACAAGCMVEYACQDTCECDTTWKSEEACTQWCEANLEKAALFSEFCRDAWEGMSACYATLDCEEYHLFHNPAVPDYPCVSEAETLAFECKGQ
jgi:hypothetical protein